MIWEIVFKLRSGDKLNIAEECELQNFMIRKLSVRQIMSTFNKPSLRKQQWTECFSETLLYFFETLQKGYYDNILEKSHDKPGREKEIEDYIGDALQKRFINVKMKNDERDIEETPATSEAEDGSVIENKTLIEKAMEQERSDKKEIEDGLEDNASRILESVFDFIETKDGRDGVIKRIYKRDPRYLEQKSSDDKEWVREVLANNKLPEEGDLAVNFAIFFVWWWNEETTEYGGTYGLKEFVGYLKSKGVLKANTSTESGRQQRILDEISRLFKETVPADYAADNVSFFLRKLIFEFEERKPEILQKNSEKEF